MAKTDRILVDTNVLLDVIGDDPVWADWSFRQLDIGRIYGALTINDVVYAELSVFFEQVEDVDALLQEAGIELAAIPRQALFLAGKAHRRYRAAGGWRTGVLPDFFIGAHAAVLGIPLITRDNARYQTYFPALTLITPGKG